MKLKTTLLATSSVLIASCGVESTSQRDAEVWAIYDHESKRDEGFCSQSTLLDVKSGLKAKLDRYDFIAPDPINVSTVFKVTVRTYRIVDSYKNRNLCLSFKKRDTTINLLIDVKAIQNEGKPLCWPGPLTSSLLCLDHRFHYILLAWHSDPNKNLKKHEERDQIAKAVNKEFESLTISVEDEVKKFTLATHLMYEGICKQDLDYPDESTPECYPPNARLCQTEYCEGAPCETFECHDQYTIPRPLP